MDDELTHLYGEALEPTHVAGLEATTRPQSLGQLGDPTAALLKDLFGTAENGLGVTCQVYSLLPILWIIDESGKLWFSIEEVVDVETGQFLWPRLSNAPVVAGYQKLGHPALLAAGKGRIAGEIFFDNECDPPRWFMSNRSGRYGTRRGRTAEHLRNASKLFSSHGISLDIALMRPTETEPAQ